MLRALIAFIMAVCSATSVIAATGNGIGALPCSRWISDQQDGVDLGTYQRSADEAWLSGFLSGYTLSNPGLRQAASEIDPDDAMASLNDYCRDHPDDPVVDAATAVANGLRGRSASH